MTIWAWEVDLHLRKPNWWLSRTVSKTDNIHLPTSDSSILQWLPGRYWSKFIVYKDRRMGFSFRDWYNFCRFPNWKEIFNSKNSINFSTNEGNVRRLTFISYLQCTPKWVVQVTFSDDFLCMRIWLLARLRRNGLIEWRHILLQEVLTCRWPHITIWVKSDPG